MYDRDLLILLNMIPQLGPVRIRNIASNIQSLSGFYKASKLELMNIPGITEKISNNIINYRGKINLNKELSKTKSMGACIITIADDDYPDVLKQIYDPPPVIYVLGNIQTLKQPGISIVGTRKPTPYGKKAAESLAQELACAKLNIVSGMARGIDSFAHWGAIKAGGLTTAVLGCGLDIVYPPENFKLYKKITEHGCAVTSFCLGKKPVAGNFPARNRIISGLSLGTLVVEAAEKSGSLITADFSLEQGREVFAIPGSIFSPYSKGTHKLIKQGAKLVEHIDDILEELNLTNCFYKSNIIPSSEQELSEIERKIMSMIDYQPTNIEQILQNYSITVQDLNAILTHLELKGLITTMVGGYVMKT
jgi:DNA processing protein